MAITIGDALLNLRVADQGFDSALAGADQKARSWVSGLGGALATGLGGVLLSVGAGLAALVGSAAAAGVTLDGAFDALRIQTGATGEELGELQDVVRGVLGVVPTSAGEAADAVAQLNTRLGLTGDTLGDTAANLLDMTRLMGGDASTNAALFARVVGDWGIANENASLTLDKFFVASQQTGAGVEGLMQKVVQFGSPLRLMGFSLEESIAMFGKWEKEGVNAELVMGSLRIAAGKFADQGKPLQESLMATIEAIKNNEDATAALALGMDVFGARAGPDMVAAIRENRFELGDLIGALEGAEGAILSTSQETADFGERLTVMKNRVMLALEPLGMKLLDITNIVLDKLSPVLDMVIDLFTETEDPIGNLANVAWSVATALGANHEQATRVFEAFLGLRDVWAIVVEWAQAELVPLFVAIADEVMPHLQETAGMLGDFWVNVLLPNIQSLVAWAQAELFPALAQLWEWFSANLPGAIGVLMDWFNQLLGVYLAYAEWYYANLGPLLSNLWEWLQVNIPLAIQTLSDFWVNTLQPAITQVWEWVTGTLMPTLSELWVWLETTLTAALQTLSDFWTNTLLPAITRVWEWLKDPLFPFLESVANLLSAVVGKAVEELAKYWEETLQPAIKRVYEWWRDNVQPFLEDVEVFLRETLSPVFATIGQAIDTFLTGAGNTLSSWVGGITGAIERLTGIFNTLADAIRGAPEPPPYYVGHSPSPFERDMTGIGDAVENLAHKLPTLAVSMALGMPVGGNTTSIVQNSNFNIHSGGGYQGSRRLGDEVRYLQLARSRSRK